MQRNGGIMTKKRKGKRKIAMKVIVHMWAGGAVGNAEGRGK